jgi:hypothetical protein
MNLTTAQAIIVGVGIGTMFGYLLGILSKPFKDQIPGRDAEWKRLALLPVRKNSMGFDSSYIAAIKECRFARGVSLKDAKEMVDKWIALEKGRP